MTTIPKFGKELRRPFKVDEPCCDCVEYYGGCTAHAWRRIYLYAISVHSSSSLMPANRICTVYVPFCEMYRLLGSLGAHSRFLPSERHSVL